MGHRKFIAAVDLGGTWVRVALSDESGHFRRRAQETIDARSAECVSSQVVRLVRLVCSSTRVNSNQLKGVGIASAGPLDLKKGTLIKPVNIPLDSVPLTGPVGDALGVPVSLVNDCAGAVLGERRFGAGQGVGNLVYVTIGTGIGGGAIVDGHLLLGRDGNAAEVGHFVIDYTGQLACGCGKKGHWEAYCSGKNMPNFVRMRVKEMDAKRVQTSLLPKRLGGSLSNLTSEDLFRAAKSGDALSLQLVGEIGHLNAVGFANIVNAYEPSLITVGGTVVLRNSQLVLVPIRKYVAAYALNRVPKIVVTPLGDDVGIYGAAAAAIEFTSYV